MSLPALRNSFIAPNKASSNLLLISDGFEERSLHWVTNLPSGNLFDKVILFKSFPERESKLEELICELKKRTNDLEMSIFDRDNIEVSEKKIRGYVEKVCENYSDIYIDISVMSRMLIMILVYLLGSFNINLHIVYSEPYDYAPNEKDFEEHFENQKVASISPTIGVKNVVRTPMLSSSIMQEAPSLLVGFTSFNEQLMRALLSSLSPSQLMLINSIPPHLKWRASATFRVHEDIINEYSIDNIIDEDRLLNRRASTLDYIETFNHLSNIYREFCYSRRIIVSPTGSKMQALACTLFKICCKDVHIEYSCPESYYIKNFSSSKIRAVHSVSFCDFKTYMHQVSDSYHLNG